MADISIVNSTTIDQPTSAEVGKPLAAFPVGPLMIAAVLEEQGYDVEFMDYQTYGVPRKPSVESFLTYLERVSAPIIGIGVISSSLPTVLAALVKYRATHPGKLVILGGPAASDTAREIVEKFPVDIVVRGEGEITIQELMRAIEDGADFASVAGITYRSNGGVLENPDRERILDLETLPLPAYHKINLADYGRRATIMSARGCPYQCTFCTSRAIWGHRVVYRDVKSIANELSAIKEHVDSVDFADDTLVLSQSRVFSLLDALKEAGVGLRWRCNGRVDHMTDELLKRMADDGCEQMLLGLESGSNRVLERIKKKFTVEQALATYKKTSQYVSLDVSFIWGFPFETMSDFHETLMALADVSRIPGAALHGHLLCAFRGSALYEEFGDLIRFSDDFYPTQRAFLPTDRLSNYPELVELIKAHPRLFASYYYYDHPELAQKRELIDRIWPAGKEGR
jgi:radical SAM superfamily enzyme YgiQ (UPF0313 family)